MAKLGDRKYEPVAKTCEACGSVFTARTGYQIQKQRFCDRVCRSKVWGNGRPQLRVDLKCLHCGLVFQVRPFQAQRGRRFCTPKCRGAYAIRGPDTPPRVRVESQGSGNPAWRGGDRLGKYWKRKARERDQNTCQYPGCGKQGVGKEIHAHHKIPRSIGGTDDLDNLITLCSKHHRVVELQLFKALVERHPEITRELASGLYSGWSSTTVRHP